MKIKSSLLAASCVFAIGALPASAALVAAFNFNTLSITTASLPGSGGVPTSISASSGTGTVGLTGWLGTVDDFAGTTLNAVGADPAEESLSLVAAGTTAPFPGNGSFITVSISMTGFEDLIVTYAHRGTATGFSSGGWSWSVDGVTFTPLVGTPTPTTSTTFAVATANFSAVTGVDNASTVTLKYEFAGATSNTGNNRIDNLQINATAVPEPQAAALLGAFGIFGIFRRRR